MTDELLPCPWCGRTPTVEMEDDSGWCRITCYECEYSDEPRTRTTTREQAVRDWNTRYKRTCHYLPDSLQVAFDEDDNEIETKEAYSDGCDYSCDQCGYTMLGGDIGWFEETEGEYGGWNYKPRFRFCPHCGSEVVDGCCD